MKQLKRCQQLSFTLCHGSRLFWRKNIFDLNFIPFCVLPAKIQSILVERYKNLTQNVMQVLSGALTVMERAVAAERSKEIYGEGIGKATCWLLRGRELRGDKGKMLILEAGIRIRKP